MFVFPVNPDAALSPLFTTVAAPAADPLTVPAAQVDANREAWVQQWAALFR